MKTVLIGIQPKWCELIASGKKTVEVRKTKPNLPTPFKVYIYETKTVDKSRLIVYADGNEPCRYYKGKGKIIGEFVCDEIKEITADNLVAVYFNNPQIKTCLNDLEMRKYANGKNLFLWHISDLVIYDKPRELGEFYTKCYSGCNDCKYQSWDYGYGGGKDLICTVRNKKPITRPPQSWSYVEEIDNAQR